MLSTVAALVIPPVTPFEFGTICEVFGIDRSADGVPPFELRVCGEVAGQPIRTSVGVDMVPSHGLDGLRGADLIAVSATRAREFSDEVLDAVRAAAAAGSTLLSVCSGAFVLGAAGLLDDRPCTTHWDNADELRERYPRAKVDPDVLFVDDGNLITSAGTAAGIDACLHLVRRELGSAVVNVIARRMVVPPQRDGGQRQFVEMPVPVCRSEGLAPVLDWVLEHLDVEHSVSDLARRARMSDRSFARRFVAETGTTPHKWITLQRVLRAQRLLEDTDMGIDEVAERSGFGSGALLRHHFRKVVGVSPADFRRTFAARSAVAGH
ncbi:helix-turn-helix domain-containing protein [Pseudonocardia sp. DSM 110487]|uniref:GlxA family transcriptional regulator n=1 Tax=Pseudonocardia sp. DSM 110487 TaxID=2865833 RepID=UPI001C69C1FF|nr:helix-turn-helix domain-containing protein [Pseudonocardia sp. DSM 110487]QYN32916.1 helix-turn-helix domain-containing protein [Pseudonocardia sp. DSM 110487]